MKYQPIRILAISCLLISTMHVSSQDWHEVVKRMNTDYDVNDGFGHSSSISGEYCLIGAPDKDNDRGAAYFFKKDSGSTDGWGQIQKVLDSSDTLRLLGKSVSISGNYAIVGAPSTSFTAELDGA